MYTYTSDEGYIEGQITLSEQPPMGDWTIKVTINVREVKCSKML